MTDILAISTLLFIAIVAVLVYKDRKNIEFYYIIMMRRTKRGIKLVDAAARCCPRFWDFIGKVSIPFAVLFMIAGVAAMGLSASMILSGKISGPAVSVVLPSFTSQYQSGLGGYAIFVPFWFYLMVIVAILVPHEFFHGVVSRALKIPLKSVGLLLLAVFPGAFVEPDEAKLQRSAPSTRLKIFSAGIFANLLTALFLYFMLFSVFRPLTFGTSGIALMNVTEGSPAQLAGLEPNMTITQVNGLSLDATAPDPFKRAVESQGLRPGDAVTLTADNRTFYVVLGANETNASVPYLGISGAQILLTTKYLDLRTVASIFSYAQRLILLLLTVAAVNAMPWKPFDGGLVFESLVEVVTKRHARRIAGVASVLVALLFLFNLFGPALMKLFA